MGCVSRSLADDKKPQPLSIQLSLREARIKLGRPVEVAVEIVSTSDRAMMIYDSSLSTLLTPKSAVMALLDREERLVANMLEREHGSAVSPSALDWRILSPGRSVHSTFQFRAGRTPGVVLKTGEELPVGKYFLELRLHERAISDPPFQVDKSGKANDDPVKLKQWLQDFPGPEICRSNRVEFEILPRTGD
jgi:hypothetical protein